MEVNKDTVLDTFGKNEQVQLLSLQNTRCGQRARSTAIKERNSFSGSRNKFLGRIRGTPQIQDTNNKPGVPTNPQNNPPED
jgi:hypothetical protein